MGTSEGLERPLRRMKKGAANGQGEFWAGQGANAFEAAPGLSTCMDDSQGLSSGHRPEELKVRGEQGQEQEILNHWGY